MPVRKTPTLSIVITARNEWPVIMGTIMSFHEDLEASGIDAEILVVDNLSTDSAAEILEDRMRRWIRSGYLRVIRYNDRPANVLVRNIGARHAKGDAIMFADAHLSIARGTLLGMLDGWRRHGGLWHTSTQLWGDTDEIRCRGYKLRLEEKFWGNLSRAVPKEVLDATDKGQDAADLPDYQVPMASHCCLLAGREQFLDFGGYSESFRTYGGGEPYLDLKWWLYGSGVWLHAAGLVRHAFGHVLNWRKVSNDCEKDTHVMARSGELTKRLKAGDEYLHYSRGYAWTNEELHHNFMASAYIVGGYPWLQKIYKVYWEQRKDTQRYIDDLNNLRREVLKGCDAERKAFAARQVMTLEELLKREPWTGSYPVRIAGSQQVA